MDNNETNVVKKDKSIYIIIGLIILVVILCVLLVIKNKQKTPVKPQDNIKTTEDVDKKQDDNQPVDDIEEPLDDDEPDEDFPIRDYDEEDIYQEVENGEYISKDGNIKIKTISRSNKEEYSKVYNEAKKLYEKVSAEYDDTSEYQYKGDYIIYNDDTILEIGETHDGEKYAIYEADEPGLANQYFKYEFIVNKETKELFDGFDQKYEFDGTTFEIAGGKYYFIVPAGEEHAYIYTEDKVLLGMAGNHGANSAENYIYDDAVFYIKKENGSLYFANTKGISHLLLSDIGDSNYIAIFFRDDESFFIDVTIYEGEEEKCHDFNYYFDEDRIEVYTEEEE